MAVAERRRGRGLRYSSGGHKQTPAASFWTVGRAWAETSLACLLRAGSSRWLLGLKVEAPQLSAPFTHGIPGAKLATPAHLLGTWGLYAESQRRLGH